MDEEYLRSIRQWLRTEPRSPEERLAPDPVEIPLPRTPLE